MLPKARHCHGTRARARNRLLSRTGEQAITGGSDHHGLGLSEQLNTLPAPSQQPAQQQQYDGMELACAQLYCHAEDVSTLLLHRCFNCEEKDARLHFPTTAVGGILTVACPLHSHDGTLTRRCGAEGWETTLGYCKRKACPAQTIAVVPVRGPTLSFGPTPEGRNVSVRCPIPLQGSLSRLCLPESQTWSETQGECVRR